MRPKLLAIHFKFLGDLAVATPALRALRASFPEWELHVLVPTEAAPLLQGISWLDRVWQFPRIRGRANLRASLPVIRQLRRERFAVSIDFVGNTRSASVSLLVGAPRRIGLVTRKCAWPHSWCYTDRVVEEPDTARHESVKTWSVTTPLQVPIPEDMALEIAADSGLATAATQMLGGAQALCYVTATQPRREWPIGHWQQFARRAAAHAPVIAFTGGNSPREKQALASVAERNPDIRILPPPEPLEMLLAVLAQTKLFVTTDTGPMHFAAALGVPTLSLFGPTSTIQWAPVGARHRHLQGGLCSCSIRNLTCIAARPCMAQITPDHVYDEYLKMVRETQAYAPEEGLSASGRARG